MSPLSESGSRPPVLVVEDDRVTRFLLERTLARWGYPVQTAGDGEEGWQLLQGGGFRIVLTDWVMPCLSGPELCRLIRRAGGSYVYAVILTMRGRKEHLVAGLEAGADDFLSKPLSQAELKVRLEVACRVLRLEDELLLRSTQLAEINSRLARAASTDPLMGIGNRRAFEEAVVRIDSAARRHEHPYGAVMFDVDDFKAYNDRHGHPAGDRVLAAVAGAIRTSLRVEDEIFRYGGEEIAVLLQETTGEDVLKAAERVREAVASLGVPHPGSGTGLITVSAGTSSYDVGSGPSSWQEVIERADAALFVAKRQGRNRVVRWAPEMRSAPAAA